MPKKKKPFSEIKGVNRKKISGGMIKGYGGV
jgi:hypothetical protein